MIRLCLTRIGPCLLLTIALLVSSVGLAQTSSPGFETYKHVRAAADDGAPDGILRIAQTSDGYIWLAGDTLYRFDGATFERIDWPRGSGKRHASPSALMVSDRGELWVGLRDTGGVAVYRQGALQDMHMPDPPRGLSGFAQTHDRTIWVSSAGLDKRLQRTRGSRWELVDDELGLPRGYIMDMVVARDGGMWVALSAENGGKRLADVSRTAREAISNCSRATLWTTEDRARSKRCALGLGCRRHSNAIRCARDAQKIARRLSARARCHASGHHL